MPKGKKPYGMLRTRTLLSYQKCNIVEPQFHIRTAVPPTTALSLTSQDSDYRETLTAVRNWNLVR